MAEGVNVRFNGELQNFIHSRIGESGLYSSASEYIRDLVRRDYEEQQKEQKRWAALREELRPGMEADESEFVPFDGESILKEARARWKANGN